MSTGSEFPPEELSESTVERYSSQANVISNALREADKAMETAYGSSRSLGDGDIDQQSEISSIGNSTIMTGAAATRANIHSTFNLKENDEQFHAIAELILGRYGRFLINGASSFSVSASDMQYFERIVNRDSFVDALRFRVKSCPEKPSKPVHFAVRNCHALGLDRAGAQNPFYARPGSSIPIEKPKTTNQKGFFYRSGDTVAKNGSSTNSEAKETSTRQQLTAELREASNLMADSVTPEAAQFWRRHVVELQNRLRNLEKSARNIPSDQTERLLRDEDMKILPLLCQPSYFPSIDDELSRLPDVKERTHISKPAASAPDSDTSDRELQAFPMVDVVAPANLPEGFTFEAEIDGCRFVATVPAGGVRKGEVFACHMRDEMNETCAPTHRWRDGLFDCFQHGICHPMAVNSIFCPLFGLSQVMMRMGTDYRGLPPQVVAEEGFYSTRGMVLMIIALWLTLNIIFIIAASIKKSTGTPISPADVLSCVVVNLGMYIYAVYATANTRALLRKRYQINEFCCGDDLEDKVCAVACMPCVVSQMGRHTVSYIDNRGVYCSDTGLEEGIKADDTARSHQGTYRIW